MSKVISIRLEDATINLLEKTEEMITLWGKTTGHEAIKTSKSHIIACGIMNQYQYWEDQIKIVSNKLD